MSSDRARRLTRWRLALALAALAALAAPGEARAEHAAAADAEGGASGAGARERANALFQRGNRLRTARRFAAALRQYQAAYRIFPSYKILLNMGLTLYDTGRHVEAAAYFERFARRGEDQSPPQMLTLAAQRLAELRRRLGRIWISCPVAGATVRIDDRAVGITPLARWIYLAPGTHRLALSPPGFAPVAREVTLRAGELRDLPIRLRARPVEEKRPPDASAATRAAAAQRRQARARKATLAAGALGLGVALAAGGTVLWGLGLSQGGAADEAYHDAAGQQPVPGEREIETLYREKDSARRQLVAGTILWGAAAAAFGVSAYCWLTRPEASRPSRAQVVASPLPRGGALLTLRGTLD